MVDSRYCSGTLITIPWVHILDEHWPLFCWMARQEIA
jgi:hypothetical protein